MSVPGMSLPLFGISFTEGLVIVVVVLVLFGATRLPKLGKGIGEGIRNFKEGLKGESDNSANSEKPAQPGSSKDENS